MLSADSTLRTHLFTDTKQNGNIHRHLNRRSSFIPMYFERQHGDGACETAKN